MIKKKKEFDLQGALCASFKHSKDLKFSLLAFSNSLCVCVLRACVRVCVCVCVCVRACVCMCHCVWVSLFFRIDDLKAPYSMAGVIKLINDLMRCVFVRDTMCNNTDFFNYFLSTFFTGSFDIKQ